MPCNARNSENMRISHRRLARWTLIVIATGTLLFLLASNNKGLGKYTRHEKNVLKALKEGDIYPFASHALDQVSKDNLDALQHCLETGSCISENQKKVVLCLSHVFYYVQDGATGGEAIWLDSLNQAMYELDYTVVYAPYVAPEQNPDQLLKIYRALEPLVQVIFMEAFQVEWCMADPRCIRSSSNPDGIPIYKMLAFNLWNFPAHPLGKTWTLGIEDAYHDPDFTYLGYSIEHECTSIKAVPFKQRKKQAFVFGKRLSYFHPDQHAWNETDYSVITTQHKMNLVGAPYDWDTNDPLSKPPKDLINLAPLSKEGFADAIAQSHMLVGVKLPTLSPSPYVALCVGVPFINPVFHWDSSDPDNIQHWVTQHDALKWEPEPYVYNVKAHDSEAFAKAVAKIETAHFARRYIPKRMLFSSMVERTRGIVERDWTNLGTKRIEQMRKTGQTMSINRDFTFSVTDYL